MLFYLSARFIWLFLSADVVLSAQVVRNAALEVEDVGFYCTKRVVVTDIETSRCCRLSCLRSFLDNLNPLSDRLILSSNFRRISSPLLLHYLSRDWLGLVEICLLDLLFFVVGCARIIQLRNLLHRLSFVE